MFTTVRGVISSYGETGEPTTVWLDLYRRSPVRFKLAQSAHMGIKGISEQSTARDGTQLYCLMDTPDEAIDFWKNVVGTQRIQGTMRRQTGLEIADEAAHKRLGTLNGYLRTAASLTKKLIEVKPVS